MEATPEEVTALLAPGSFSVWSRDETQTFYREDETIKATYSTGMCPSLDDRWEVLPTDIWNVPKGRLIEIDIEPKERLEAKTLGIDISNLRKERPFRSHKNHFIYFDRDTGIALYVWGTIVDTIRFFPSRTFASKLCDNDAVKRYFHSNKLRIRPEPKHQAVDFNYPPKVLDVQLTQLEQQRFSVVVKAEDPEYDVLVYLYKISGGRIVGTGSMVIWDLTDLAPGKYTLTAAVDDGMGPKGRFITKSVMLP